MQVLTFAALVAHAVATGMGDVNPESSRVDQIMLALNAQEARLAGVQPALEEQVAGATVWQSPLSGFVVQDEVATPITAHAGYSEAGAHVLHNGKLHHVDGMGHVPVSDELWALFQASVWSAAG
jgi:hypothetical protein